MTTKILEAFAADIRKQNEWARSYNALNPLEVTQGQIRLVCRIAKQFNPRFNEGQFRQACQPTNQGKKPETL